MDTIVFRDPHELRPWEFTQEVFRPLSPEAFSRLVEDVRRHGIRIPVEIDPQDRILCGHERTRAAKELGIQVPCRIVTLADELDYKEYALRDNLLRRQLSPSEQARVVILLEQIEMERRKRNGRDEAPKGLVRNEIGRSIGLSGRQVVKYRHLGQLPAEVQQMVDRGELSLETASILAREAKGKPAHEVIRAAEEVAGKRVTRTEIRQVLNGKSPEPEEPGPASPQAIASLWMGLGSIVALEGTSPVSIVTALEKDELEELGRLLSRAHAIIVKLNQEVIRRLKPERRVRS